jgi:hypothetical protein
MGSRRARLTVVPAALVLGCCGADRAVSGAADFVKAARSVRIQVQEKAGNATRNVEILCPDRVRVTAETTSGTLEVVAIGSEAFGRTGEGPWIKVPLSFVNAPPICSGSSWRPEAQDLGAVLHAMTRLVVSEQPIGPRAVNGVPCQDWEARERGPAPKGRDPRIRLCLGTTDKRPMQITLPDGTWTFADWNADVTIEAPQVVKGEAVASGQP